MIEAMKQALEALEKSLPRLAPYGEQDWLDSKAAITSLRQAIREHAMYEVQRLGQEIEQEAVECDGDFPEGFDKSLDIPAQALRQANAALCEVTNNRMWDVPALAERMLMFCRNTHPPQRTWVGLTEQEQGAIMEDINAYGAKLYSFADAIEAKLKEKNT